MSEHMVLRLSANWAVLADDRQWMLCKRRKNANSGWKPLSYVASSKAVLLRCLREKGPVVDAQGQAALGALPESFQAWKQQAADGSATIAALRPHKGRYARNPPSANLQGPTTPTSRCTSEISPLKASAETKEKEAAR